MANRNCVFCYNYEEHANIIPFTDRSINKCREILALRKAHKLKYDKVVLPAEYFKDGYHRTCYKGFTGLMKKYYTKSPKSVNSTNPSSDACTVSPSVQTQPSFTTIFVQGDHHKSATSEDNGIKIEHTELFSEDSPEGNKTPELYEPESESSQEKCIGTELSDSTSENRNVSERNNLNNSIKITCLFCRAKNKMLRSGRNQYLQSTDKYEFLSKLNVEKESDIKLVHKMNQFLDSKVYYHPNCKQSFINSCKKSSNKNINEFQQYHDVAFDEIIGFIKENVLEKGKCYSLSYLHGYYMDSLHNSINNKKIAEECSNFTAETLAHKVMIFFKKEIKFFGTNNKILGPKDLTTIDNETFKNLEESDILLKAALVLRKSILQSNKDKIPEMSTERKKEKEFSAPQNLADFYSTVIAGTSQERKNSSECIDLIKSCIENVTSAVLKGNKLSNDEQTPNRKRRRTNESETSEMAYPDGDDDD